MDGINSEGVKSAREPMSEPRTDTQAETVIIRRNPYAVRESPNPRKVASMRTGYQYNPNIYPTTFASVPVGNNIQRNGPCPCGSGKKYKKCHGAPKKEKWEIPF
jgi:preprotein translocase subunit SecA